MQNKSQPKFYLAIFIILMLAIVAIAGVYLINFAGLRDTISNLSYIPTSDVLSLEEKLTLTDSAKTTFRATRPALESQSAFNDHCQSHNSDISVLGCYTNDHIYIYNIDSPELSGIVESTAAHELLHAAWDRLPESEKSAVSTYLNQVYSEHYDSLSEDLHIYDDADQLDELHSRIGTQIAALPDYLENYYARYFADQDAVVAYYTAYITPFNQLRDEIDALKEELDTIKSEIDADTAGYYSRAESLSAAIAEFNACADAPGCFPTTSEFSARREDLVDEQNDLEDFYNSINAAVEEYNQKVAAYNNNILRTEELQNTINSNAKINNPLES